MPPRVRTSMLFLLVGAMFFTGCSARKQPAAVDAEKARETLRTALDAWKRGEKAESLARGSPAISVQDLDWMGGWKLTSYEVLGPGEEMDAHLLAKVKLTLVDPSGSNSTKEVTYIISTAPALTVFRKVL